MLGNDAPEASVVGEVIPGHEFYDFEAKYLDESLKLEIPAQVPGDVRAQVRELSLQAFQALDCEGFARVDFFYEEATGRVLLNEVNTIPGFTPRACSRCSGPPPASPTPTWSPAWSTWRSSATARRR